MSDIVVGSGPKTEEQQQAPVQISAGQSVASASQQNTAPTAPVYTPPPASYTGPDIVVNNGGVTGPGSQAENAPVVIAPTTPISTIVSPEPVTQIVIPPPILPPDTTHQDEIASQDEMVVIDVPESIIPMNQPPEVPVNEQPIFVDAPGMESYVENLSIPVTGSGVGQQGWVDRQISFFSGALDDYGKDLEAAARREKLAGNDVAAGAEASAAVAVGVGKALFDIPTWMLNPYDDKTTRAIEEFKDNPLFVTGYVGGNVAVALYGAAELYEAVRGTKVADIKAWLREPDAFIDINPQIKSPAKLIDPNKVYNENFTEAATTYPVGSDEYNTAMLTRGDPTAYSMVEWDESLEVAAMTPLDLDAPIFTYPLTRINPYVAATVVTLGSANLAKTLLSENRRVISQLQDRLVTRNIQRDIVNSAPKTLDEAKIALDTVVRQEPIQQPIQTPVQAPIQQPIQTPIMEPMETPVEVPIEIPILEPIVTPEETPEEVPVEEEKPSLRLPKPGKQGERRRDERRREVSSSPAFTVSLRYGKRTVTRSVEARTFREALAKTLKGSPAEVEVRRTA